jgi:hypothetical protein
MLVRDAGKLSVERILVLFLNSQFRSKLLPVLVGPLHRRFQVRVLALEFVMRSQQILQFTPQGVGVGLGSQQTILAEWLVILR